MSSEVAAPEAVPSASIAAPRRTSDGGFTLLETLIALVLASILAIGLVRYVAASHLLARHADESFAVATLIAELGSALPASADMGSFDRSGQRGDLRWHITSRLVRQPAPPPSRTIDGKQDNPAPAQPEATPQSLWRRYAVSIDVTRDGALVDRAETIRLGPAPKEAAATMDAQ